MKDPFKRHFSPERREDRKVKSDPPSHIICIKRNGTAILFTRREEGEQMSLRPTSGSKSPRRKTYPPAHISESVKATRHPGGHVSLAAGATRLSPGTTHGYSGAGACVRPDRSCHCVYLSTRVCTSPCLTKCTCPHGRMLYARYERLNAVDSMMDASGLFDVT